MARRSPWAAAFQRTLKTLQRGARRTVVKATKQALRASIAKPRPKASTTRWLTGLAVGSFGGRAYRILRPAGARPSSSSASPLLVLLHGCAQDASAIARSTRVQALAAREGFVVLCPEQDRLANAQGCWNWFQLRSGRAETEAASIVAAIDQACALHGADPHRVVVAGFSAGASMAALLGMKHPERFAAVAMHSGVAPASAQSAATALRAMQGRGRLQALPTTVALPPLLVIQGTADGIVTARNGELTARWWAAASAALPAASRRVKRGARRAATITDYRSGTQRAVTLAEVDGLGHAWSGGAAGQPYSDASGPDAMRMIWAFAARAFTERA
jgi:poly(hydroxyalkanoate) depolymerase family esterase